MKPSQRRIVGEALKRATRDVAVQFEALADAEGIPEARLIVVRMTADLSTIEESVRTMREGRAGARGLGLPEEVRKVKTAALAVGARAVQLAVLCELAGGPGLQEDGERAAEAEGAD